MTKERLRNAKIMRTSFTEEQLQSTSYNQCAKKQPSMIRIKDTGQVSDNPLSDKPVKRNG